MVSKQVEQCDDSKELFSLCENSNPNAWMAEKMLGHSPCGIYGYSHMLGGFAGGQAEYARVPFANVGTLKIPEGIPACNAIWARCSNGSQEGQIDPSFVITHRMRLDDAPKGYDIFLNQEDGCVKVVLKP